MKKAAVKYILVTLLTALMTVIYNKLKLTNDQIFNKNFRFSIPLAVLVVLSLTLFFTPRLSQYISSLSGTQSGTAF